MEPIFSLPYVIKKTVNEYRRKEDLTLNQKKKKIIGWLLGVSNSAVQENSSPSHIISVRCNEEKNALFAVHGPQEADTCIYSQIRPGQYLGAVAWDYITSDK